MCLGIPGRIIKVNKNNALADLLGVEKEISIQLVEDVKEGEYVIVHAGAAISKIDEEEAKKTIELFEEIKELSYEK